MTLRGLASVWVGDASGSYGDRRATVRERLEGEALGVLTGDHLWPPPRRRLAVATSADGVVTSVDVGASVESGAVAPSGEEVRVDRSTTVGAQLRSETEAQSRREVVTG